MEKIKFKDLKQAMLQDEIEFRIGFHEKENYWEREKKQCIKDLKKAYSQIKSTEELVSYLDGEGYRNYEAYELILKYLIKK